MGRRGVKLRFPPKLAYLDPESNQETSRGPLQIPLLPRTNFVTVLKQNPLFVTRQFFFHQYQGKWDLACIKNRQKCLFLHKIDVKARFRVNLVHWVPWYPLKAVKCGTSPREINLSARIQFFLKNDLWGPDSFLNWLAPQSSPSQKLSMLPSQKKYRDESEGNSVKLCFLRVECGMSIWPIQFFFLFRSLS